MCRRWRAYKDGCMGVEKVLVLLLNLQRSVLSAASLGDGHVVSGCIDETLRVWWVADGTCKRALEGHSRKVACLCTAD